jgi:hypothetical protein
MKSPHARHDLDGIRSSSFCATHAFANFLVSAVGSGLSMGKWMAPLDVVTCALNYCRISKASVGGNPGYLGRNRFIPAATNRAIARVISKEE